MRKIAVITGTRAEYGLLKPLIIKLEEHKSFELQLVVTGSHLSFDHGHTVDEIKSNGIENFTTVDLEIGPSVKNIANSMAVCLTSMVDVFSTLHPEMILILGDRYEIFATAQAAVLLNIPIIHIHGGETTRGAIDDVMRHCITKMSHVHFTSTEIYRQRVIQLGENPKMVFNTGSLGQENVAKEPILPKRELEKRLNYTFQEYNILVTYHPVTSIPGHENDIDLILQALARLPKNVGIIITAANADTGGAEIIEKKKKFASGRINCIYTPSLGMTRYVSVLRYIEGVVGNSSSGIYEAPSLGKWALNIGPRQEGRQRADNVVDCEASDDLHSLIRSLIKKIHPASKAGATKLFGDGNASTNMIKALNQINDLKLGAKLFHDL